MSTGNRQRLPENADGVCAACSTRRGNQRRDWHRITERAADGAERVVGWTCPQCPQWSEPIRRLGADRFRVVVDATAPKAARRRQVTRTLPTLEAARAFVEQVRAEVADAGGLRGPETIAALCDRWLESRSDVRPVTVEGYRNALAPVLRHLGARDVREVTVRDIESLAAWMGREGGKRGQALGPRSVRAALVALAQALDVATYEGVVPRNVVRLARRPRQRALVGRDLEHWQAAELLTFRDTADTDALAAAWRLTLCGLTRADVMGLRWSDVDLAAGVVTIRQGRVALDGGDHVDEPKSAQRRRAVPVETIHAGTVAALRSLRAAQAADRLRAGGAWTDSGLAVVDALGLGLRPEVYSDRFRRLARAAGVPPIRLHSVRHSLAFWLHSLGVPPADAAALLGHTVEVHLATYLPESGATGIAAAAAALGRATTAASTIAQ